MMQEPAREKVDLLAQLDSLSARSTASPRHRWSRQSRLATVICAGVAIGIGGLLFVARHPAEDQPPPELVAVAPARAIQNPASVPSPPPAVQAPAPPVPLQAMEAPEVGKAPSAPPAPSPVEVRRPAPAPALRPKIKVAGAKDAVEPIRPYRNGEMARPLTGEALRRALAEDRRITREFNALSLDTASAGKVPETR